MRFEAVCSGRTLCGVSFIGMRVLLLGGFVGPLCFLFAVVVGSGLRPEYDHATQVMSALGATGSPNASLMNLVGFGLTGLWMLAFSFSLARLGPRSRLALIGSGLLVLFSSGIVGAGVYSCDPGCVGRGTSPEALRHIIASAIAFAAAIAACFVWAAAFRPDPLWRRLSGYSALAGLLSVGLLYAFNTSTGTGVHVGIWQRLFILSIFSWSAVVGVYGYRATGQASAEQGGAERRAGSEAEPGACREAAS